MQVYRHIECLGTRQKGLKIGVVEESPANESIGHGSQEAIFPNGAFQFVR